MSGNVTNLGNQAQTNILTADTQVRCPNFSQPEQVVGSAASPVTTLTQAYVAGINKYVWYYTLSDGVAINQIFTITGLPTNFPALYTVTGHTVCVASAAWTTVPVVSDSHQTFLGTTLSSNPKSATSPGFSSGTAYMKVSITFTLD